MGGDLGDDPGVKRQHAAGRALFGHQRLDLVPELDRALRRAGEELCVPIVGGIVRLDKIADIDFFHGIWSLLQAIL